MEPQFKMTVIVPCYNVSLQIDDCMKALEAQTIGIENMQIILVNDCSTDATLGKLLQWERKYPDNILVIPLERNVKQGAARNIALEYVAGEYIGFVDADDFIEPTAFEETYNKAKEYNADILCYYWKAFYNKDELTKPHDLTGPARDQLFEVHDYESKKYMFINAPMMRGCWDKIYRSEFVKKGNYRFAEGVYDEESLFTMPAFMEARRVYCMNRYFYWYFQNPVSTTFSRLTDDHQNDNCKTWLQVIQKFKQDGIFKKNYELIEWLFFNNYYRITFTSNVSKGQIYTADTINNMKKTVLNLFPGVEKNKFLTTGPTAELAMSLFKEEVTDDNYIEYNKKWFDFYNKYGF